MAGDGSAGGDSAAGGGLATAALRSRFGGWRLGGRRLGGGGGLATAAPRSQFGVYLSFSLSFSLSRCLSVLIRGHIQDLCGQSFMHKNVQSVLALRLNPHPQGLALFSTHAVRSRSAQFPAAPALPEASAAAAPWSARLLIVQLIVQLIPGLIRTYPGSHTGSNMCGQSFMNKIIIFYYKEIVRII